MNELLRMFREFSRKPEDGQPARQGGINLPLVLAGICLLYAVVNLVIVIIR